MKVPVFIVDMNEACCPDMNRDVILTMGTIAKDEALCQL